METDITTLTSDDLRARAAASEKAAVDSFERSDTDGFLSQWASGITADLYRRQATIADNGGHATFTGLYRISGGRVAAKLISGTYGLVWLVRDDETGLPRFVGYGSASRKQKQLGLCERQELAPAKAAIQGSGSGLSGAASAYVGTVRTGDDWGMDAVPA